MGRKKNKNKNRAQPFRSQSEPASTISESEKENTICYICDKRFICPCESERCIKPKKRTCALASYSNIYPLSRLLPTNDRCYLVHTCSDSCAHIQVQNIRPLFSNKNAW